jgi:hypothetical protein
MQKIVINKCYGGFSLSDAAIHRYAEIKGITLYPEKTRYGVIKYWTVPPESRPKILDGFEFYNATMEERKASNEACEKSALYDRDIARDDPALVKLVKEMGKEANSRFSSLKIVNVPDGVEWEIDEYDGIEWVAEKHRVWE